MAQTKKKRRRKHSGTQAGTIERRAAPRRPQTKEDRKLAAAERREQILARPPTWKGAVARAALTAVLFLPIAWFLLSPTPAQAVLATAMAFGLSIPAAYYTDRRRHRKFLEKNPRAASRRGARRRG